MLSIKPRFYQPTWASSTKLTRRYQCLLSADAYLLQLQKYELPPTPPVTPVKPPVTASGSASTGIMKTPLSGTTPPKGPAKASPPNGKMTSSPSVTPTPASQAGTPKVVMQSPSQSPKPQVPSVTTPVKSVTVAQKQNTAGSHVPGVIKAPTVMSTGSSTAQSTATATTAVSGAKAPVQGQAVNQGQAASAATITNQGLALLRAPVQLPPGVQATMITNAQGIPVMRLQGAGIQGTAPVTLVTSQVGATQLQGATIVRMAAPIGGTVTTGAGTTGTVLRLPVQSGGAGVQGTAVLKIPVTTSIQMPGTTGLTLTAMAGSTGQAAVIRQQLPVTVPANLPPGTQLKVGPQGQLTAVGPGGIPVQLTLQNVKTQQVATGLQVQQGTTLGTPTVVQIAGASPVKAANTAQLVSSSSSASPSQKIAAVSTQGTPGINRPAATTTTMLSTSKPVMTTTSSIPSAAAGQSNTTSKTPSSPVVSSTSRPPQPQVSQRPEQKTLATAFSAQSPAVATSSPNKQNILVAKQDTKATVAETSAAALKTVASTAVSTPTTTPTPSPIKTQLQQTITSRSAGPPSAPSTVPTSSIQAVKTAAVDSATLTKPKTTAVTASLSTPTPTPTQSVVSVARVTSAESTAPSSSTQLSRPAVTKVTTVGVVKGTTVTTTPVVSAVTAPLVSTSVSTSTPVAVVSPLITTTRPAATVAVASPAKVTTATPVTVSAKPSPVTSAVARTVNGGVGVTTNRSATPTSISKVIM